MNMKRANPRTNKEISPSKIASYIVSFIMLIIIIIFILLALRTCSHENDTIYAGVGGCVNDPGVYPIQVKTTLFELIRSAKGAKKNADLARLDLDMEITPWEVYCIPCKAEEKILLPPEEPEIQVEKPDLPSLKETAHINIIYAGLPRTFILITIYPEQELLLAGHLPWFTAIPDPISGTKTLYESYLYEGTSGLVSAIQNITNQKIDFYFCQDRPAWIKFIDHLGGIKVDIPESFAKQYYVNPGIHIIDGYTSWLYITFISKDMRQIDFKTGSHNRIQRQKAFMLELYKKFVQKDFFTTTSIGREILNDAESNLTLQKAIPIAMKVKNMKNRKIEYFTYPGIYKTINGEVYWETKLQEYQQKLLEFRELK